MEKRKTNQMILKRVDLDSKERKIEEETKERKEKGRKTEDEG